MIRAYTQRLLPPYSGVVLIAETNRARAQSFDGINWDIQYLPGDSPAGDGYEREQGYALDRSYFRVAHIYEKELETYIFPVHLDAAEVTASIHELSEFLSTAKVPFPIADLYEYWLLDGSDESPLALIFSCCTESQMATYPVRVNWTALPHSKMRVENTAGEQARRESPVNDRFQRLISSRAGVKPKAAWFKRHPDESHDFPPLLVREDWEQAELEAEQVLGSVIGFGLIYLLLGAVWVFVLDRKIRHGPEPASGVPGDPKVDLVEAAASRPRHSSGMTGSAADTTRERD